MKLSVNVRYMFVQGMYWTMICVAGGFISLYLLGEGVSNSGIGITNGVFAVLSALLQPVLGRICDRNKKISWKKMILICALFFTLIYVIMYFVTGAKVISSILVGLTIMAANIIMPFVNSAVFYYENSGEHINFGVARGTGSGVYAIASLIIGNAAARFGIKAVPVAGIIIGILFVITILLLPYNSELDNTKEEIQHKSDSFIKKYPVFFIMIIGCVFLLASHNITCNFMLQIIQNIGGNSSNMGVTMAIQAILEVPVLFSFSLLLKKFSSNTLMGVAAVGYVLKAVAFYLAGTVNAMYAVQATQIVSFALFASASVYYTGAVIDEKDRTTGQAFMTCSIVCGNFIGSIIGGPVIDKWGVNRLLLVNIIMSSIGACIALVAVFTGNRRKISY